MRPRPIPALILLALLAVAAPACKKGGLGANASPSPTPTANPAAAAAAAQELFKAMHLDTSLNDTSAAMIDSEISRNPGLTPYRQTMLDWLRKYMTWQAMQPELTRMYLDAFSETELKQMADFYSSPTGQKSLQKLPDLMQRTAMAGARLSQEHQDELRTLMSARSEELKKEAAAGGGPGGAPGGPGRPGARPPKAPSKPQP